MPLTRRRSTVDIRSQILPEPRDRRRIPFPLLLPVADAPPQHGPTTNRPPPHPTAYCRTLILDLHPQYLERVLLLAQSLMDVACELGAGFGFRCEGRRVCREFLEALDEIERG